VHSENSCRHSQEDRCLPEALSLERKRCELKKKSALTAWSMITQPKSNGGLGVVRLETHNKALLLKFLHKFFNNHDLPWVNLVWNNYYRTYRLPRCSSIGSFDGKVCLVLSKISRDWQPQPLAMEELFFSGEICGIRAFRLSNIRNYFPLLATTNSLSKKLSKKIIFLRFFSFRCLCRPMNCILN
jgi:hypothetical protein